MVSNDQLARAARAAKPDHLSPPYPDSPVHPDTVPADAVLADSKSPTSAVYSEDPNDPNSHWIHRDKLARIENEELQAAGLILPKSRSSSNIRHRDRSVENFSRTRKASKAAEINAADITVPTWDLRLPHEVVASDFFVSGGARGGSKIPIAKTSPLPIRDEHLEREAPLQRKCDSSPEGATIRYTKPRSRSASASASQKADTTPPSKPVGSRTTKQSTTDRGSPKEAPGAATRKPSAKTTPGKPKGRSGPRRDSTNSSGGRPSTRSGELSSGPGPKPMEGDPPWMVSAYTPDPRLPPDQQLLPTVAKRLQQEKWEREGKFGNIYDKEFRPLTEQGFKPPGAAGPTTSQDLDEKAEQDWPLRDSDTNKGASSPTKTKGYSTIPKIQDKPLVSPVPSPRSPLNQPTTTQPPTQPVVQVPTKEAKKKDCGCCGVM